jgi:tetratricopeptide (TPR) repeat protein
MGGLTSGSGPLTGSRDIVVSLAGPLTGLVLLGLPALWLEGSAAASSTGHLVVRELLFVNVAWSGVNLLPVLPLDGGQVSASVLRRVLGDAGQRAANVVSIAVSAAAALFAYTVGYPFGALFAVFFVATNYSQLRQLQAAKAQQPLVEGYRALAGNDVAGALSSADRVLGSSPSPSPDVAASAVELRAWARFCSTGADDASRALGDMPRGSTTNRFLTGTLALDEGRTADALDSYAEGFVLGHFGPWSGIVAEAVARHGLVDDLVDRLLATPGAGPEVLTHLQSHLHAVGRFPEAAAVGQRAFDADPADAARVAYNVACSWARAGKPDAALDWLERAADAGFADGAVLDADRDLEPLRATARFRAARDRVAGKLGT